MQPHPQVVLLKAWLKDPSLPNFTYHTGLLMQDRLSLIAGLAYIPVQPLSTVADLLWRAQEEGKVALVQKKIGNAKYKYVAQKINRGDTA